MKNVHNEHRLDLESVEFMNKSLCPMIKNPGMIKKAPRASLSSNSLVQQGRSPSTNHDEGCSSEQEPSRATDPNENQCKPTDNLNSDMKGSNKDIQSVASISSSSQRGQTSMDAKRHASLDHSQ